MSDHQQDRHHLRRKHTPTGRTPLPRLPEIELGEVSVVDVPANTGARHVLHKHRHPVDAATLDRATAAADQVVAGSVVKSTGASTLDEAVGLAREHADRPASYWRNALRELGNVLAPGAPPSVSTANLDGAHPERRRICSPKGREFSGP